MNRITQEAFVISIIVIVIAILLYLDWTPYKPKPAPTPTPAPTPAQPSRWTISERMRNGIYVHKDELSGSEYLINPAGGIIKLDPPKPTTQPK